MAELEQDGIRGYGEAPQSPYYGAAAADTFSLLERARARIEAARLDDPADFWEQVGPLLDDAPFAQCALDVAAHDLWGKLREQPLWKLWGLQIDRLPPSDYTIGIDSPDVDAVEARRDAGLSRLQDQAGRAAGP